MTYHLAFYKEVPQPNGDVVRLELHQGIEEGSQLMPRPVPLGDVLAGLSLNIEGQSGDIDEPIVKTSLNIDLVDAPERNTLSERWGDWEIFYTSNSVGWKVILLGKRAYDAEFRTLWGGYVTPDSYAEVLQYHGVVTVTARDNIGHLQDFDFDAEGNDDQMITPFELITQAWEKIACPLTLDWRGAEDENIWPQTNGVNAIDTYMNVSAFEGKSWYDAVSETLYAFGLAMRYVGNNKVAVCPLRRLAAQSKADEDFVPHFGPLFEAYATRELTPAVKEIKEEVKYELEEGVDVPIIKENDFTGEKVYCDVNAVDVFGSVTTRQVEVWPIENEGEVGWGNLKNSTLFFNPFAYRNLLSERETIESQMFLATNTNDRMVWYGKHINCQRIEMTLERGAMIKKTTLGVERAYNAHEVKSITGAVKLTIDGTEYYYDGTQFKTSYTELTLPLEEDAVKLDILFHKLNGQSGLLQFFVFRVNVEWTLGYPDFSGDEGVYLGFKPLNFSVPYTGALMEKNTIKTVYDAKNNVIMSRTPALGPVYDVVAMPGLITNGIFRKDGGNYVMTEMWKWPDEEDSYQLGVLVHLQLLKFHEKPFSLISGTILNADLIDPAALWVWKGKEHLLLSGTYNFMSGRLEGAVLREFVRYKGEWIGALLDGNNAMLYEVNEKILTVV